MRSAAGFMLVTLALLILIGGMAMPACAAPKAELWPRWQASNPQSSLSIDHSRWAQFLDKYLVVGKPGAVNLVRYAAVSSADKNSLADYLAALSRVAVTTLNRAEQKALWINLYNALTVQTILAHSPVKSIREISSGWFSGGPWDLKLIKIEGIELSLNDIEHRILRPIWQDNRVHYAVNCASYSCPNLQTEAFTAENSERLLDQAARAYVNSSRGVRFAGDQLVLSSIYDWYQVDFGGNESALRSYLQTLATPDLAERLSIFQGAVSYDYDWKLNGE